jgi:hypothetical protein
MKVNNPSKCFLFFIFKFKFFREILWFSILKHEGIADLLGYCVRGDRIDNTVYKKGVIILTEPGVPVIINIIRPNITCI